MRNRKRLASRWQKSVESLEQRLCLAAATVNFNTTFQTIDGFGAQPGIGQNPNPPDSAMQLAYSQTNGIGLEFIRGSLSANGYDQIVGMTQRAAAYGVQMVESPRGPAVSWLKDYGNATNGELDPAHYQDYANMVADYVQNSAAQGIPVYSISMAVEPDLATTITPVWNGQEFAALLPYFANTFRARGITTKIMVNEDVGWETADRNPILADPGLSQYVSIVADHAYGQAFNPYQLFSNNMGKQVWMTEAIPQVSTDTQIQNAVLTATDIHNAIAIAGANAYLDCFLNFGAQGLMSSWTSPNISLYAMGNFSKFIRPGWVRVGETDDGGLLLTTFKDPASGKFAIVSINSGTTNVTETYTLSGLSASSVTPYTTSASSNLTAGGAIAVTGGSFSATIPASSIVTYYGISSTATTLQAPVALYAGTMSTAQTSQIALSWTDNSSSDTAYTIERSTNGSDWTVVTSTWPAGTTTYVDSGLNEASTYYYRVKATNGAAESPYSAVATGSTFLGAPSNVTSTGMAGGRNLSWLLNSGVSTGVTIQRSTDGLIWSTVATLNTRATSYADSIPGYNSNEIYWYRVRNTYGSQTSAYGAYNTTVNTPANFTASLASPTSVTLTWTNTSVGAYAAYINQNGTAITPPNLSVNADTFTVTGLTENTAYSFTIQALGPEAWFRPSAQITYGTWSTAANTSITTPLAPPSGLTAVSTVAGAAVLNWVDNSAVETAYDVERSTNGSSWTVLSSTLAPNTITYTDMSAPTGTVYYRVKAVDSTVSSAFIRTQMVSTQSTINTSANPVTGTAVTLVAIVPGGFGSGTRTYIWSLDGTPPGAVTFVADGVNTSTGAAFSAAGSYVFRVTVADSSGNSTSATVTVVVNQTLSSITVTDTASPASFSGAAVPVPAIVKSTWQQLVATGLDQFGTKLIAQPAFSWSVISGGGSVSSAGLYAAPTSAASPVVRASFGAIWGQVTLSVLNTAQLKADYSFNETSGWNLQDALGVGITAKMSGGAALVSGHLGNAVSFDGVSGSVWLGNPDALDIRGQITLAAWIKPASTSGTQMIVGRAVAHYPNQSATYLRISNGQYQVGFYDSSYRNAAFTIPAADVGHWVYLAGAYDGKNWNLYRNGALVATFANSKGSTYVPESWRIGSSDQPDSYFSGSIDSVRLYAQALTATEVSALYSQSIVITSSAAASPTMVTNVVTSNLSVAAVDPDSNSDSTFTYNWSLSSGPAAVGFGANGTNAARNTVATFSAIGTYMLMAIITDVSGTSVTSSVTVTVNTIVGTSGNDTIRLFRSDANTLAVYINNAATPAYSVAYGSLGAININSLGGNDTITLDFSGAGSPIPPAGLTVDGQGGFDTLNLIGAAGANAADLSPSTLTFDGATTSYANIESIKLPQSTTFNTLTIESGALLGLGNSAMLTVGQLNLAGTLDVNTGELILQNGGAAGLIQITNALKSGFNASFGYWNVASGILSSAAAGDPAFLTTLGVLQNSASDITVKYTYYGDADLSGTVNGADYQQIDNGFGLHLTGWSNGDFNGDGVVDGGDYALIDNAFNQIAATNAGPLALMQAAPAATPASPFRDRPRSSASEILDMW